MTDPTKKAEEWLKRFDDMIDEACDLCDELTKETQGDGAANAMMDGILRIVACMAATMCVGNPYSAAMIITQFSNELGEAIEEIVDRESEQINDNVIVVQ